MQWTVARHVIEAVAPALSAGIADDIQAIASGVAEIRRPADETIVAAQRAADRLADIVVQADKFDVTKAASRAPLKALLKAIASDAPFRRAGDRQSARQISAAVFSLTDAIYAARQMPPSVTNWSQRLLVLTELRKDCAFDREGFLKALDAIPAELK
jgi:hypothetical protein